MLLKNNIIWLTLLFVIWVKAADTETTCADIDDNSSNECTDRPDCGWVAVSVPSVGACTPLHEIKSTDCEELSEDDCAKIVYKCDNSGPCAAKSSDVCDTIYTYAAEGGDADTICTSVAGCVLLDETGTKKCIFKEDVQTTDCEHIVPSATDEQCVKAKNGNVQICIWTDDQAPTPNTACVPHNQADVVCGDVKSGQCDDADYCVLDVTCKSITNPENCEKLDTTKCERANNSDNERICVKSVSSICMANDSDVECSDVPNDDCSLVPSCALVDGSCKPLYEISSDECVGIGTAGDCNKVSYKCKIEGTDSCISKDALACDDAGNTACEGVNCIKVDSTCKYKQDIQTTDCMNLDTDTDCEKAVDALGVRICVWTEWTDVGGGGGADVEKTACVANDGGVDCERVIKDHCSSVDVCALVEESDTDYECKAIDAIKYNDCEKLDETKCKKAYKCEFADQSLPYKCNPICNDLDQTPADVSDVDESEEYCESVMKCVWLENADIIDKCQTLDVALVTNANCDYIQSPVDCDKLSAKCDYIEEDSICVNNINHKCHTSIAEISVDNMCNCSFAEDKQIPDKTSSSRCSTNAFDYCVEEYMAYYSVDGLCKCIYDYNSTGKQLQEVDKDSVDGGCSTSLTVTKESIPKFGTTVTGDIKDQVDFLLTIATESEFVDDALEELSKLGSSVTISNEQAKDVVSSLVNLDPGFIEDNSETLTTILTNCAEVVDPSNGQGSKDLGTYPEQFAFVAGQILGTMNYESFNGEGTDTLKRIIQSTMNNSLFQGTNFVIKNVLPVSARRDIVLDDVQCSEYSSTVFAKAISTEISTFGFSDKTAKSSTCTISFGGVESKSKCESESCTSTYAENDETLTCECTTANGFLSFNVEKDNGGGGGGLSGGAIAGIIIGAVVVVVVVVVIIVLVMRSKSKTGDASS